MKILEFLEEDNGDLSSTRLAFLAWAIGVLVVWAVLSLKHEKFEAIDNSVVAVLGIFMTGKVTQKFGEKPPQSNGAAPPPAPTSVP